MLIKIFDHAISFILLIVLSPVFILVSIAIFFNLGIPVLYKQKRPGLNEKIFTLYKFRTMRNLSENAKNDNDISRITKLGNFLRKTSLDELPSLINVLKGEMSLVGPRPLLIEYLELYDEEQKKRHQVKPGITGWAQVNGRNSITWEDKFSLDLWYVENRSFLLNLKILLLTVKKVFLREGVNASNNITMKKFEGTKKIENKPNS